LLERDLKRSAVEESGESQQSGRCRLGRDVEVSPAAGASASKAAMLDDAGEVATERDGELALGHLLHRAGRDEDVDRVDGAACTRTRRSSSPTSGTGMSSHRAGRAPKRSRGEGSHSMSFPFGGLGILLPLDTERVFV
jgi:hypothetical protein